MADNQPEHVQNAPPEQPPAGEEETLESLPTREVKRWQSVLLLDRPVMQALFNPFLEDAPKSHGPRDTSIHC